MRTALASWPLVAFAAALLVSSSRVWAAEPGDEPASSATPPPAADTAKKLEPVLAPKRPWAGAATLGIVSLPRTLSLEALVLRRREEGPGLFHFGFGAGVEYLPKGLASFGPKTDFSWLQFGVDGRYFPWRWLFVGGRVGWQFARTDSEKFGSEVDYVTSSFFVSPKAGVLHTFANGLTIGGDFGATIPIGAETKLDSDGTEDSGARKASKTFGAFVMPFVSLFRIGYTL
jgi:hypothetical protein